MLSLRNKAVSCPSCKSQATSEIDCPECDGLGHEDWGDEGLCVACGGVGVLSGEFECFDCGHGWTRT